MKEEKINLLLVEDNPMDARLVIEAVQDTNDESFELDQVNRFEDAIDHLKSGNYQVIILDLNLPDSHGLETYERMRKLFPNIPIVIFTGDQDETTAFNALQEGIEFYLIKSKLDAYLLKQVLRYAIKKNRFISQMESEDSYYS